jgi:energy-coupling factor transporter ATP-binding protein EcfA2
VPFARIAPPQAEWWRGYRLDGNFVDAAESLRVKLGPAGASKAQELVLGGKGTSQHALIVGRTGSGKSTLLHTLITNLALTYSPDEVQLYLIDFKKGVEFQSYARARLPHARVIAIESEREFGLSVLQGLKQETDDRGTLFTSRGASNIAEYRSRTGKPLPRLLLLVDEFQLFFAEDDAIASQSAQIIDHLVRQGRAFGVHVILASQTLAGSYALPRTTVDQMSVRIALQCSDADSRLILADDNPAARLLERPGQAIYNTANGRSEGNNFFQVAYLDQESKELERALADLRAHADANAGKYAAFEPIIFEGNVPGKIEKNQALAKLLAGQSLVSKAPVIWLGDPVAIRDAVTVSFRKQSGANLLVIGQNEEAATGLLSAALLALAAQLRRDAEPGIHLLDFSQGDDANADFYTQLSGRLAQPITIGKRRQMAGILDHLAGEVQRRLDNERAVQPALFLLVHGLQRARDLRQEDSFSSFASFSGEPASANPAQQFATILRDGPEVGMHTIVWCDTVTNLNRTLERRLLREFALRVAFQMSAEDSSTLLDSPVASKVGPNRAYLYSEDEGRLEKFRPYGLPPAEWLATLKA